MMTWPRGVSDLGVVPPLRRRLRHRDTRLSRFRVSDDLFDHNHNGREYERFAGQAITVPHAALDQPDPGRSTGTPRRCSGDGTGAASAHPRLESQSARAPAGFTSVV